MPAAAAMPTPASEPTKPSRRRPPPVYQRRIWLSASRSTTIASVTAATAATQVRGLSTELPAGEEAEGRQRHRAVREEQSDVEGRLERGLPAMQQHDERPVRGSGPPSAARACE